MPDDNGTGTPSKTRRRPATTKAHKSADFAAQQFAGDDPESLAFYARFLILSGLPYSDPGERPHWTRTAGNRILTLQAGANLDVEHLQSLKPGESPSLGYPYGILPRYLMAWIATEVKRTKSQTITTGKSLTEFFGKLGLQCTGGKTGTIARFNAQFWRLVTCRITSYAHASGEDPATWKAFSIADEIRVWDRAIRPGFNIAGAEITLTNRCYEELLHHAVRYNPFILPQFTGSAFQLDLYFWLTYRLPSLKAPLALTWAQLQSQFGSTIRDPKNFRTFILRSLRPVHRAYPEARFDVRPEGLVFYPSRRA